MTQRINRVISASAIIFGLVVCTVATAQESIPDASQTPLASNLFHNFYTQGANTVHAGMYPAPYPVPSNVGHSYYTYQPLMPHEHMHTHRRSYYNYYANPQAFYSDQCDCSGGGYGLNRTTVVWQNGTTHLGPSPVNFAGFQKHFYKHAAKKFCLGEGCTRGGSKGRHGISLKRGCKGGSCGKGCAGGNCGGGDCASGGCN